MRSAAVPCMGLFRAVRSAKFRKFTCGELISGIGRVRPKSVVVYKFFRTSATVLSKNVFTPRYFVKYALMNCAGSRRSLPNFRTKPKGKKAVNNSEIDYLRDAPVFFRLRHRAHAKHF